MPGIGAASGASGRSSEALFNTFQLLGRVAELAPESTAVVIGAQAEEATYGELLVRSLSLAADLQNLGLASGDRVALWHTNSVDWIVCAMAVARLGGVLAPVNTRWTLREAAQLVELVEPRLLIAGSSRFAGAGGPGSEGVDVAELGESLKRVQGLIVGEDPAQAEAARRWMDSASVVTAGLVGASSAAAGGGGPLPSLESLLGPPGNVRSAACDRSIAAILATSGTTSRPKAVMLRHESLTRLARCIAQRQGLGANDRLYTIAPFFHCSGLVHGILTALAAGCTLFATAKYRAEETEKVIRSMRITSYHGFALPLKEAAALPAFEPGSYPSLRGAWFSAPGTEMAELEERYGAKMCELYGLTECGGNSVMTSLADNPDTRHNTDGYPHEGIEVWVFDPEGGARRDIGQVGEIRIRGWNVMRGYFRNPEATERSIDADGWLHTGDAGVMDAAGNVTFLSRLDDMIRVGGENVNPAEVEEVLVGHPGVAEAAAVGVAHPRLDKVVVAFVLLRPGATCSPQDLTEYCSRRLATFKVPRDIVVAETLPRTGATLRVRRAELREQYEALKREGR
jgi:fatty-acyl-CoA synthase